MKINCCLFIEAIPCSPELPVSLAGATKNILNLQNAFQRWCVNVLQDVSLISLLVMLPLYGPVVFYGDKMSRNFYLQNLNFSFWIGRLFSDWNHWNFDKFVHKCSILPSLFATTTKYKHYRLWLVVYITHISETNWKKDKKLYWGISVIPNWKELNFSIKFLNYFGRQIHFGFKCIYPDIQLNYEYRQFDEIDYSFGCGKSESFSFSAVLTVLRSKLGVKSAFLFVA